MVVSEKHHGKREGLNQRTPRKTRAKAQANGYTIQQDELEAMQIVFYEVGSWIEKTASALTRMTKELEGFSGCFERQPKMTHQEDGSAFVSQSLLPKIPFFIHPLGAVQSHSRKALRWDLSFQPGNLLRFETNITSIDSLISAVQSIEQLIGVPAHSDSEGTAIISRDNLCVSPLRCTETSIEFWQSALKKAHSTNLEHRKHADTARNILSNDVSASRLRLICQAYWDCLFPKFYDSERTVFKQLNDPKRNDICTNSALAVASLHFLHHHKSACSKMHAIACSYYDSAREALQEAFDRVDYTTIEALLNLSMFCILCKRHSQARAYISLCWRMIVTKGLHRPPVSSVVDKALRKRQLKLLMVLYYNDFTNAVYSGESAEIDDDDFDVDFYELLELNDSLPGSSKTMIANEIFFTHLLELVKIGKKTLHLLDESHDQGYGRRHCHLPLSWEACIHHLESALREWMERLPKDYRADPEQTLSKSPDTVCPLTVQEIQEKSSLLLMLQYQAQWITLHKPFLTTTSANESLCSPHLISAKRSHAICSDAANRIIVIAELITQRYGWCTCQQFLHCIYQASTIYCHNALDQTDEASRQHAISMLKRTRHVLTAGCKQYSDLPDILAACVSEFMAKYGMIHASHGPTMCKNNGPAMQQFESRCMPTKVRQSTDPALDHSLPNVPKDPKEQLKMKRPFGACFLVQACLVKQYEKGHSERIVQMALTKKKFVQMVSGSLAHMQKATRI